MSTASPPLSQETPNTASNSPTSPRLQHPQLRNINFPHQQSRQLRPPKSPLYVPAVLRPTERHAKPSPLTPPRSAHGSFDSTAAADDDEAYAEEGRGSIKPVSRRSTADSGWNAVSKMAEDEWLKDANLGEVTGTPTRDHWKADSASPSCDSPTCRTSFGLFLRRHHCRHCGHVFCASHTPHTVPLDQNAHFHPLGEQSRACDLCWKAYRRWEKARLERLAEIEQDLSRYSRDAEGNIMSERLERRERERERGAGLATGSGSGTNSPALSVGQQDVIASSVPRDWSWSTF